MSPSLVDTPTRTAGNVSLPLMRRGVEGKNFISLHRAETGRNKTKEMARHESASRCEGKFFAGKNSACIRSGKSITKFVKMTVKTSARSSRERDLTRAQPAAPFVGQLSLLQNEEFEGCLIRAKGKRGRGMRAALCG
jgi:hypothetical protein